MTKIKTTFFCQNCGAHYSKWIGQCFSCKKWNTIVEEVISVKTNFSQNSSILKQSAVKKIKDIAIEGHDLIYTYDQELNKVLGKGIVKGSLTLFAGEPGIGKSTLLLQLAIKSDLSVFYISGEESLEQISLRAKRLSNTLNENCYLISENKLEYIVEEIKKIQPQLIIIDSIQTLQSNIISSAAGSVSQVRECTNSLMELAKSSNISMFIVGHITKDGSIAGPKVLEHMVDTVLQFEGDKNYLFRILRVLKNRFGSTSEMGIYEMTSKGLVIVNNPSQVFVSKESRNLSGTATSCAMEGIRPLMLEIQALVSSAVYGVPQRTTTGLNTKRLNMLLAVLEKRANFKLGTKDVFINITGGLNVDDPSIDLAVVSAILSSNMDLIIDPNDCFAAEIGLSGEIRPIPRITQRVIEAEKLGYKRFFISSFNKIENKTSIEIKKISNIAELIKALFA